MKTSEDRLRKFDFFKDMNFKVHKIQPSQQLEKTFMVENLDDGQKYKVRINTDIYPNSVSKELNVLKFFAQHDKQYWMPDIIHLSPDENILITTFIDGVSLDKIQLCGDDLETEIGLKLANLLHDFNSLTSPEVMNLATKAKFNTWYDFVLWMFKYDFDRLNSSGLISQADIAFVWKVLEHYRDYFLNVQPCLIHGDLKPHNIIWNEQNKTVHLIDFESCRIGDPLFDTYRIRYDFCKDPIFEQDPIFWIYRTNTCIHWLSNHYYFHNEVVPAALNETNKLIGRLKEYL